MGDRREQLVNGEGIVIGVCNSRRLGTAHDSEKR
jgi:sugar diacid utilization regulator